MNSEPAAPSRILRTVAGLARALLWLMLAGWSLFALSWGVLHFLIVPRIGDWRPELEKTASHLLGIEVRIGALQAESTSAIPTVTLVDVRLLDASGREALRLPRVLGALSVRSLLSLGFEQLVIDAPVLELRRDANGRITVAGIPVTAGSGPSEAANWFFSQREFMLRRGVVRWSDEQRPQAPPLELRDVELLLRNPGHQHQLRLDATPPVEWGQRFSLRGRFRHPLLSLHGAGQWQSWSGQLYGEFAALELQPLRRYLDADALQALELQQGRGGLRLWADWRRGQWTSLTADLALRQLALRLGPELEPLALRQLGGRIELQRNDNTLEIATHDLAFRTGPGTVWPGGNLRYRQTQGRSGEIEAVQLQGDRLDLRALRQLAQHLPLPPEGQDWLQRLEPSGLFERLDLQWRASNKLAQSLWQAKGRISGLELKPGPDDGDGIGRPGLQGLTMDFDASQAGGQAMLQLDHGRLDFPGVFEQPRLDFDELQAELRWRVEDQRIEVDVPQLKFANADARGHARGRWQTSDPARNGSGGRFPGRLELDATLDRADGARVHRYLPLGVAASARHYVRDAVARGRASDAQFRLRGDLSDFPFEKPGSGEFSVRARLNGVDYSYVPARAGDGSPGWPALQQVEAELQIDRVGLLITHGKGQLAQAPQLRASQVEARIDNFTRDPLLQLQAHVDGPASDALTFVNRSPLLGITGHALEQAHIDGKTQVQFQLRLPLLRLEAVKVEGQVQFGGNDLRITPGTPALLGTSGQLRFSDKGFQVPQAKARLLGGEIAFQGGMNVVGGEPVIQFKGQGNLSAEGLRQSRELGVTAMLGQLSSGGTSYQAQLEFRGPAVGVLVSSSLQGLELRLPGPLGKPAATALPLRYEARIQPGNGSSGGNGWRDLLSLDLGAGPQPLVSARYERQHDNAGTHVLRGALALNAERPALPAQGVSAKAELDELVLDAWQQAVAGLDALPADVSQNDPAHMPTDTRQYWPTAVALRARRIEHESRSFHDVRLDGAREQERWRATIEAREIRGQLDYTPAGEASPGRIFAKLDRLSLQPGAASEVENLLQHAPTRMPALDITVQELELGARKLGRLEIEAINRVQSLALREVSHEWRLNKLNLTVPEAQLHASGNWAFPRAASAPMSESARRTALQLRLDITDAGALLGRLGMPGVVRGGKGSIEGGIAWLGSPLALHYPSLDGDLTLDLERGQFLQAEPGLAKLLGVLSLQALPRRLTLDFRDIFSAGFAFDSVRGDARIAHGVISSHNLQMKGVNAAVLLDGSADIARETQDITAVVIPELNAGTASLIASFAHPVVGLGSLLAQYLLGKPLQEAVTQQFHVSGSWADPKVEKIPRSAVNLRDKQQGGPP